MSGQPKTVKGYRGPVIGVSLRTVSCAPDFRHCICWRCRQSRVMADCADQQCWRSVSKRSVTKRCSGCRPSRMSSVSRGTQAAARAARRYGHGRHGGQALRARRLSHRTGASTKHARERPHGSALDQAWRMRLALKGREQRCAVGRRGTWLEPGWSTRVRRLLQQSFRRSQRANARVREGSVQWPPHYQPSPASWDPGEE